MVFVSDLQTRGSTLFLLSSKPMVTGRVALLDPVPNAVVKAFVMLAMNRNGFLRVTAVKIRGSTMKPCINRPANNSPVCVRAKPFSPAK